MRAKTKRLLEGAAATEEAEAVDIQQLVELEVVDSQYHFTPLTWACCAGNTKVVARILRELEDKDVYCTRQSCWRVAGECVCHHHGSHGGAQRFRQGDPKGVFHRSKHEARADLEDGSCLKRMDDVLPCSVAGDGGSKGWTALHMAASKGRLEIVQLLIDHVKKLMLLDKDTYAQQLEDDYATFEETNYATPRLQAAVSDWRFHNQLASDPSDASELIGWVKKATPAQLSKLVSREEFLTQFLDAKTEGTGKITEDAKSGVTPLHLAAQYGHHEVVQVLERSGSQSTREKDVGTTQLMFAAVMSLPSVVAAVVLVMTLDRIMALRCEDTESLQQTTWAFIGLLVAVLLLVLVFWTCNQAALEKDEEEVDRRETKYWMDKENQDKELKDGKQHEQLAKKEQEMLAELKKVEHKLEEKEERGATKEIKVLQEQERELQDELSEIRVQRSHTLRSLSVDDSDGGEQMHMANPLSKERQGPEQGDDT